MGGEDELGVRFHLTQQLDHIVVDGLVVQIIFRLVDDDHVVLALAEDIQQQGRSALPERMVLQFLAAITDHEAVGHLPGDELDQVLHKGLLKDLGCAACLGQSSWQRSQKSSEIGVVFHDRPQGGFADIAAFEKLLHEADGSFFIAFEVGFDLQGGVAGIHTVQFRLDGVEFSQPKLVELVDFGKQGIADAGLL